MSAFPDMQLEMTRTCEDITEALYNGTSLTIWADEDGVFIEHGQPTDDNARTAGPYFDLLEALRDVVGEL